MASSSADKRALVFGATGLVGSALLDRLLASPRYARVITVGRRVTGRADPRLEEHAVELEGLGALTLGAEDAFVCLGSTRKKAGSDAAFAELERALVLSAARAAQRAGASRLAVVSTLGADPGSRVPYSRVKGEIERALAELGFASLHLLRPAMLAGHRAESRPAERAGLAALGVIGPLMVGPLSRYRAIEAGDVAEAMLAVVAEGRPGVHVYESEELRRLAERARLGVEGRPS